jgi:amidase
MIREFALLMQKYPLVVLPVSWLMPLPLDADQKGEKSVHAMLDGFRPLVAMSLLGLPSLAAPTGLANGIPVGVQIVASRFREDLCFAAGEVIESHTSVRTPIDPRPAPGRA